MRPQKKHVVAVVMMLFKLFFYTHNDIDVSDNPKYVEYVNFFLFFVAYCWEYLLLTFTRTITRKKERNGQKNRTKTYATMYAIKKKREKNIENNVNRS